MDKKEVFQERFQARLDEWEAQIDVLQAKARKAEADARLKYLEEIDELKALQKKAQARMEDLKHAHGEAWKDLQKGAEAAWNELGEAVTRARKRFS